MTDTSLKIDFTVEPNEFCAKQEQGCFYSMEANFVEKWLLIRLFVYDPAMHADLW